MRSLRDTYLELYRNIDFERIKDHPNILIAACFWEEERYLAAKTCYKFMRAVDDLIDDHKSAGKSISENEREQFIEYVDHWLRMIFEGNSDDALQKELTETMIKFRIPSWPLEAFGRSMIYDIYNDGFETLQAFINYAGGASVAPAAIFVHLAGLRKTNGQFSDPLFDVKEAAQSCAIFSYLVHIIRDFQKDQLNNLNYFADDQISKHGLSRKQLSEIAHGGKVTDGFRNMMGEYFTLADEYRVKTYNCISNIWPFLEPRYQLSLEIIFELYLMVFERIDIAKGKFTTAELNPSPKEAAERVLRTILNSATIRGQAPAGSKI
ncbi:MAG: squalene/phytoene synthase family protein [Bacteroidales bacterium]|jgi:phytoene synthase